VAVRKTNKKKQSGGASQAVIIFWLIFIIVIISVFMINRETILENFNLFKTRLTTSPGDEKEPPPLIENEPEITVIVEQPAAGGVSETSRQETEPVTNTQNPEPAASTANPPAQSGPQTQTPAPVRTIERTVYFTQIRSDGHILYSGVNRRLPVTESPMMDALNSMLNGPSSDELGRGIINMIPQQTRILSAAIRGSTAYINFSEDFLFNTFGVEGYVAQLRQIVWTVTEFPNVSDVQVLIEGRRMDYLGEGIWIGSPISRQSF